MLATVPDKCFVSGKVSLKRQITPSADIWFPGVICWNRACPAMPSHTLNANQLTNPNDLAQSG
jgi:hypothetical protein